MIYCILIDAIFVVVGNGGRRIEHEQGNNILTVHKFFFLSSDRPNMTNVINIYVGSI